MDQKQYTKLSDLVDSEFTVEKVNGYKFKKWDAGASRMLSEDKWFEGSRKVFAVDTDRGALDLSETQLGTLLVKVQHAGSANVVGATFAVKSNGKTGIDIRYFFNAISVGQAAQQDRVGTESQEQSLDMDALNDLFPE